MPTQTKKRQTNLLRLDPSRTSSLRKRFMGELNRRFDRLRRAVIELVEREDAFGLKPENRLTENESIWTPKPKLKLGSVQINILDKEVVKAVKRFQYFLDAGDILELEDQPHITIRYGLHPDNPDDRYDNYTSVDEAVEFILQQYPRIPFTLGNVSLFENDKDVLKIDIDSPLLHVIHAHLGILPNTETYSEYQPHLTIAYLVKGSGRKYLGMLTGVEAKSLVTEEIVYSSPEREQTEIPLVENLVENTRWKFRTQQEQLRLFEMWLKQNVDSSILTPGENLREAYWEKYIDESYKKGVARAYDDLNKGKRATADKLDFYEGSKSQFLSSAFNQPASVEKVKLLAGRVFTDLEGVTEAMGASMKRSLVDGMIQGKHPREIAREMVKNIDGIGKVRANTIARTEIMRAHSEGQLDAFEKLGVTQLGVMTEWSTAGDDRVCPLCESLEGIVVSVKEGRGMLPRHPSCRCVWLPANVGEDTTKQIRSQGKIKQAIDKSVKEEIPKRKKRSLTEQKKLSRWTGAGKKITKDRPKSLFDKAEKKTVGKKADTKKQTKTTVKKPAKKPVKIPQKSKTAVKEFKKGDKLRGDLTAQQIQRAYRSDLAKDSVTDLSRDVKDLIFAKKTPLKGFKYQTLEKVEDMISVKVLGVEYVFPESMIGTVRDDIVGIIRKADKFPSKLVSANKRVIYSTQANKDDPYWAIQYNDPGFKSAATGGDGTITVYRGWGISTSSYAHESGHNLAKVLWDTTAPPLSSEYGKAQVFEDPVSDYGKNSSAEDFAEAVAMYTDQRHGGQFFLKDRFPKKFKALKNIFGVK